jgi:hypothetical protein
MQQVKIRIQEITGALACTSNKGSHGPDSAVDKARAKLGIHNKSAEQVYPVMLFPTVCVLLSSGFGGI